MSGWPNPDRSLFSPCVCSRHLLPEPHCCTSFPSCSSTAPLLSSRFWSSPAAALTAAQTQSTEDLYQCSDSASSYTRQAAWSNILLWGPENEKWHESTWRSLKKTHTHTHKSHLSTYEEGLMGFIPPGSITKWKIKMKIITIITTITTNRRRRTTKTTVVIHIT